MASTPADVLIGYWPIVTTIIEFLCQYYISHPKKVPDRLWGPPRRLLNEYHWLVTWRWPGCEADHSFPFNVKVKSEWSCTSSPRICLQGAYRDDCALAMLFMFIAATVFDADRLINSSHFYCYLF